jgi:hypothetical protein
MPFAGSIYPAVTLDLGPFPIALGRRLHRNAPAVPCTITNLGNFDATRGGHLILFDYGLVIEFSPNSTAQILSGCVRYANTAISGGEYRAAMTQYMSAGLSRHVAYGFRPHDALPKDEAQALAADGPSRRERVLGMLSTLSSLLTDRLALRRT